MVTAIWKSHGTENSVVCRDCCEVMLFRGSFMWFWAARVTKRMAVVSVHPRAAWIDFLLLIVVVVLFYCVGQKNGVKPV